MHEIAPCPACGNVAPGVDRFDPDAVTITCRECGLRAWVDLGAWPDEEHDRASKEKHLLLRWKHGDFAGIDSCVVDVAPAFFQLSEREIYRIQGFVSVASLRDEDPLGARYWKRIGLVSEATVNRGGSPFYVRTHRGGHRTTSARPAPRRGWREKLVEMLWEVPTS